MRNCSGACGGTLSTPSRYTPSLSFPSAVSKRYLPLTNYLPQGTRRASHPHQPWQRAGEKAQARGQQWGHAETLVRAAARIWQARVSAACMCGAGCAAHATVQQSGFSTSAPCVRFYGLTRVECRWTLHAAEGIARELMEWVSSSELREAREAVASRVGDPIAHVCISSVSAAYMYCTPPR